MTYRSLEGRSLPAVPFELTECHLAVTRFAASFAPIQHPYLWVRASFGSTERHLTVALVIALLVHLVVIFQVRFEPPARVLTPATSQPALEVTLVHRRTSVASVRTPDYLAQVSQQGGGTIPEVAHLAAPSPPPSISVASDSTLVHPPTPASTTTPHRVAMMEVRSAPHVVNKAVPMVFPHPKKTDPLVTEERTQSASAAELVANGLEIASLSSNQHFDFPNASRHPRSKYISASTREYRYAAYMTAWQLKVERIGNLNYPSDARRQNIYGSLILDVALGTDGEVRDIRVVRTSGHKLLDDTAIHIVQLSAPFARFPPDIRKDTDILHITRTWQFRESGLSGGP
ncbi:periplasmic protein TonB [Gammaproteobacteria bacterium]